MQHIDVQQVDHKKLLISGFNEKMSVSLIQIWWKLPKPVTQLNLHVSPSLFNAFPSKLKTLFIPFYLWNAKKTKTFSMVSTTKISSQLMTNCDQITLMIKFYKHILKCQLHLKGCVSWLQLLVIGKTTFIQF